MGKKAKFKKIRRLASQMPVINVNAIKAEKVDGYQLIAEGVKEVEGKPVEEKGAYRKKSVVKQPLNHNRQMKRLYNKQGIAGVNQYAMAVVRHVQAKKAKHATAD